MTAVIHLSALAGVPNSVSHPAQCYDVNLLGTLHILELCRKQGIPRFVVASTSSVYGGDVDGSVAEDADADHPLSPYAVSKKAAENLLHTYHSLCGTDVTVLRYFNVYGPVGGRT